MTPQQLHDRLVAILMARSVQRGVFTLASGRQSDLYVDVKQTSLNAEGSWIIASLVLQRLRGDVVAVGGLTLGADPIACATASLSWASGRPVHAFIIRKESKGHGLRDYLEGRSSLPEGSKVAIVEDTTTTGGSLMMAVERARAADLDVVQCITVVDRQEGAAESISTNGLILEALTTRAELLRTG
jgi:orotate phosphoribosyltransferase